MNKTYTLVDIINDVLSKKEGHLYALNSNYICYKFLNDKFYGDDIITVNLGLKNLTSIAWMP